MTHPRWARQIPLECQIRRFSPLFHSYEKIYSSYDRDELGFLLYVAVRVECHRPRHSSCPITPETPKKPRCGLYYLLRIHGLPAMHITIGSLSRRPPAARRGRRGVCVQHVTRPHRSFCLYYFFTGVFLFSLYLATITALLII